MKISAPILGAADLTAVCDFTSTARRSGHRSTAINTVPNADHSADLVACKMDPTPSSGSFNLVIQLRFEERVQWMFKIPAHDHIKRFNRLAPGALVPKHEPCG